MARDASQGWQVEARASTCQPFVVLADLGAGEYYELGGH